MAKFIFNGTDKTIYGDYNPVGGSIDIDIKIDLYSEWKKWVRENDNAKYEQAFSTTGGDPISGTISVGSYFFLENDWKIQPSNYNHRVVFNGNLYTRDDSSPFLPVSGFSVITETTFNPETMLNEEVSLNLTPEEIFQQKLNYAGIVAGKHLREIAEEQIKANTLKQMNQQLSQTAEAFVVKPITITNPTE